jgi:anti-anti-sigma factor
MPGVILPASRLCGFAVRFGPMHVEVRKAKDVVIVDLSGKLLAGVGDEILRNVVNELLAEGWKKILLNLSEVAAIDSAGTGELVASLKVSERFGAKLKLLNLHERVRKSLHLSQLLPVFEVYDEENVALQHYA